MRQSLPILLLFLPFFGLSNQTSSEIYVNLQKLQSLKKVLYIAAHPDDENTRALAWFSLHHKAETAYLSLTRGDGGQNLIGNELGADLGVLRTQELLAARSFDGASQFFTRAVDFGYSKSSKESLALWGKDAILADVVLVIRKFKPEVIVTRFPPDKRAGHGHHTASALLAIEAFDKAADPNYLPGQVAKYGVWQTTSLYWNSSSWWDKTLADKAENNPDYIAADIGTYDHLLGKSYNEIGTKARSQHKCQGFGAILERGERIEYFEYLKGVKLDSSFFEKSTNSWSKITNLKTDIMFSYLLDNFDFKSPENNVNQLLKIRTEITNLPDSYFKSEKLKRCNQIIFDCLGLHLEILVDDYAFIKNDVINITLNAINRSNQKVSLTTFNQELVLNKTISESIEFKLPNTLSTPYWLERNFDKLFYADSEKIGQAENLPMSQNIKLKINETEIEAAIPITYKWRDPSYGERNRSIMVTPEFTVNFEEKIVLSKSNTVQKVKMKVHSFKDNLNDKIILNLPIGWSSSVNSVDISLDKKHNEEWIEFEITPSKDAVKGQLFLTTQKGDTIYSYNEITYDHIPTQTLFQKSSLECVKIDAKIIPGKVAYISAVDDNVPAAIKQLGFSVDVFSVSDLSNTDLSIYRSVVLGIRVYNIHPELSNFNQKLETYVENGGNLIMQYNTASRSEPNKKYGVVPFELSRNRVTDESSEVKFLNSKHPIMNYPNKITQQDFDGWVQERGLYFADNWDKEYTPLFSWHDEGEDPQSGALIVAKYGKGQFMYTGISFFRELPVGVEGAFRLFANMLSYESK